MGATCGDGDAGGKGDGDRVLSLAGLAARYAAGRGRSGRAWPVLVESRLGDIGEVDEVSVLPLVERLTPDGAGAGALRGEPGVSYLVRAGGTRLRSTPDCQAGGPARPWSPSRSGSGWTCPRWMRW